MSSVQSMWRDWAPKYLNGNVPTRNPVSATIAVAVAGSGEAKKMEDLLTFTSSPEQSLNFFRHPRMILTEVISPRQKNATSSAKAK